MQHSFSSTEELGLAVAIALRCMDF